MQTLLAVDDTPENLLVLGELLSTEYNVHAANSGPAALRLAAREPRPDLILLDLVMPGMDGYEVLRRLRADAATRDIPVICVTALNDSEHEERGLAAGAVDYMAKPLREAVLRARVRAHIELKLARDRLSGQKAWLEEEVSRRLRENLHVQAAAIHALARLAETRDPETGNHLLRTQAYVRRLGQLLQRHRRFSGELDDRSIELIADSAPLHDIGKVGIPDHILLKPGRLDEAEWTVMKTHARIGAEALEAAARDTGRPVEFLTVARQIALHHHERWDGQGYPDGLAGDAIPVPARLMAVADVFDALISRRVYKEPMPHGQAREIIERSRGTHLDPDVVDAFLADFDGFCRIASRHADTAEDLAAKRR